MEDLILDFNLYLCEKFGYRNSCSVMQNANGFCVNISERDLDCYIRFWEYSCGRGNFPDWSIIIVRSNFKKNQEDVYKRQSLWLGRVQQLPYSYSMLYCHRSYLPQSTNGIQTTPFPYNRKMHFEI